MVFLNRMHGCFSQVNSVFVCLCTGGLILKSHLCLQADRKKGSAVFRSLGGCILLSFAFQCSALQGQSMLIAYTRFCFKDMHLHQMLALPPFSDCRCTQLTWISALLEMSHCAVSVLMFCYTISIQAFSSQQSYRSKWFQCTTT